MNEAGGILESWIIADEGFRGLVYDDATGATIKPGSLVSGHPTIGFGIALDVNPITRDEALMLMRPRYQKGLDDLRKGFGWFGTLSPARQAVLGSMTYQMGFSGFLKFQGVIKACQLEDWGWAAREMLDSRWAIQTPARAKRLAKIMETGSSE